MPNRNPYETYPCIYCDGGCHCTGDAHHLMKSAEQRAVDEANCQPCDVCDGTGELTAKQLNEMAAVYRADEREKSRQIRLDECA